MVSSRGTGSFSPVQGALQPSAAAARLAPFIRQPALAYGLLGVLRPMRVGRSVYRQLQRRAYLLRRQKVVRIPLGQQRPIKRLKQPFLRNYEQYKELHGGDKNGG